MWFKYIERFRTNFYRAAACGTEKSKRGSLSGKVLSRSLRPSTESTPLRARGLRVGRGDFLEENESSVARRSTDECWVAKPEACHINYGKCTVPRKSDGAISPQLICSFKVSL